MNIAKTLHATKRRLQRLVGSQGCILLYHRVTEVPIDPWGLCVSPAHFAEHLDVLRRHCSPISLDEMARRSREGRLPPNAVTVTFDDGYADNLLAAQPLLERFDVPASVFIITGYTESNDEFWWDELERVLLRPGRLPETLRLTLGSDVREWKLGGARTYSAGEYASNRSPRFWDVNPDSRLTLYYNVCRALQPIAPAQRASVLQEIREWAQDTSSPRQAYRQLRPDELLAIERGGLVTVGAHTVSHPFLKAHPPNVQQEEILQSKKYLEAILAHPVDQFSYPFGAYGKEAVNAVRAAGFSSACSTVEEPVWRFSNPFELPRFEVQDWDGMEFERKVEQWFRN